MAREALACDDCICPTCCAHRSEVHGPSERQCSADEAEQVGSSVLLLHWVHETLPFLASHVVRLLLNCSVASSVRAQVMLYLRARTPGALCATAANAMKESEFQKLMHELRDCDNNIVAKAMIAGSALPPPSNPQVQRMWPPSLSVHRAYAASACTCCWCVFLSSILISSHFCYSDCQGSEGGH
jgi:hypothetical protein